MESDPTSDEPLPPTTPETLAAAETDVPVEPAEAEAPAAPVEAALEEPGDPLAQFAERSGKGRLAAAEEEQATQLLTSVLLEGRDGVARAVEILPRLPWVVGVNGVVAAWPEMKPAVRNRLLAGLARQEGEGARRVRLSLARGLFKLEPAVAAKLAGGVAKEMREKETGALAPRDAQVFANVLIGRAKPWIAQLPLADMKPAEADLLVHCALVAAFSVPHAPVTQLGVLKWAADAKKLDKLHPSVLEAVIKGLGRWSGKWQGALRREVEGLPEEILSTLKAETPPEPAAREPREPRRGRGDRGPSSPSGERPDREDDEERDERAKGGETEPRGDREEDDDEEDEDDDEPAEEKPVKVRPVYESKTVPPRDRERERDRGDRADRGERERRPAANFNLTETLRQIEAHVASLRNELSVTQNKLRTRDDDRKPRKPERGSAPTIPGEPTAEELARLNVQLEARNAELQQRIEDLTVDSEERAASTGLLTDTPVADADLQLRHLLILKLKEDHEDFLALEHESPDIVAPKHYRTVLTHVFEVLAAEGILGKPS